MTKPRVILAPSFRQVDEIFDDRSLERLHDLSTVVWGRDEPMPTDHFLDEVPNASAVVFGTWTFGDALEQAGPDVKAVLEVAGGHHHPELDYPLALGRGFHVGSCAPAFAGRLQLRRVELRRVDGLARHIERPAASIERVIADPVR